MVRREHDETEIVDVILRHERHARKLKYLTHRKSSPLKLSSQTKLLVKVPTLALATKESRPYDRLISIIHSC